MTVATAGRAVFFSGLTVLLGLLGLVLFEFMILRSVGMAGAIVVGLAVAAALTLLPAILAILGTEPRPLERRGGSPRSRPRTARGRGSPGGSCATRSPCSSPPCPAAGARPAVPARPVQRPGRDDPPGVGAVARVVRHPRPGVRRGRVRAARDRGPDRPGPRRARENLAALYAWSRRLAEDPRISRVASLVDVDPRLTLEQYQLLYGSPAGPPDRFVATALARDHAGRPHGVHADHAVRAQQRRRAGRWSASCATPIGPAGAARRRLDPRRRRRGGRRRRRQPRLVRLPADRRVHRRSPRSWCCSCCSARSCSRSRRWS